MMKQNTKQGRRVWVENGRFSGVGEVVDYGGKFLVGQKVNVSTPDDMVYSFYLVEYHSAWLKDPYQKYPKGIEMLIEDMAAIPTEETKKVFEL